MYEVNRVELKKMMLMSFGIGDLHAISFDLGIDREGFSIERADKNRSVLNLIQYMERHNRFGELVEKVQDLRPSWKWESSYE